MKPEFHNPENIALSDVPKGWRFCLVSEMRTPPSPIKISAGDSIRHYWANRFHEGEFLREGNTYITSAPLPEGVEFEGREEKTIRLLRWFIDQFEGDSGTGASHWDQFEEFCDAKRIVEEAGK